VTEAHRCEQLAQDFYAALPRVGFEPVDRKSNALPIGWVTGRISDPSKTSATYAKRLSSETNGKENQEVYLVNSR